MSEPPALTLLFYSYGIVMRKQAGDRVQEYPVSPEDVEAALEARVSFSTGLILPNTIYIHSEGATRTVVEYRPPQKTPIWLEGSEDSLLVPLPGLLMARTTTGDRNPGYRIHAVAERPMSLDAPLYRTPLPNIGHGGSVCWGTVTKVSKKAMAGNDLAEDWAQLLATPFGGHAVDGKSKTYSGDIRKLFMALDKRKARVYPKRELIIQKQTLRKALALPVSGPAQDWGAGEEEDDPENPGLEQDEEGDE